MPKEVKLQENWSQTKEITMSNPVRIDKPAPDFELETFNGKPFLLSDFEGKSNILLVFNRGFTWPYCRAHMSQLRDDHSQFSQRDTTVVVVGPEGLKSFNRYWDENNLPFIGLPDPSHSVLKRYGQQIKIFKFGRMPAQAIIDKNGIVRYIHYGNSMSDIPSTEELLKIIDQIN